MNEEQNDHYLDAFNIPVKDDDPRYFYDKLLKECPEHEHLLDGEAVVDFLVVRDPVIKQEMEVLGSVHLPTVQGRLKGVFNWMLVNKLGRIPDFLVLLDKDYWMSVETLDREILIHHEMCHMIHKKNNEGELRFDMFGNPVWGLRGHSVEEFNETVSRYGAYSQEIREFIAAATNGSKS